MEKKADIQYIFDENGKKTCVIIPVSLWKSMGRPYMDSIYQEKRKKIESLFGALKDSPILDEIDEYSQITRRAIERV